MCSTLCIHCVIKTCSRQVKPNRRLFVSVADSTFSTVSTRRPAVSMQSSPTIAGFVELQPVVQELWSTAIAPRTRTTYQTGFDTFLQFLLLSGFIAIVTLSSINVTEDLLIYFVAHCYNTKLSYSTIKLYLCGIRFMCMQNSIPYPLGMNMTRLSAILGGVKRAQVHKTKPRYPVTFPILRDICLFLRKSAHRNFSDLLLETVCTVAFFGFLRCGEFTVTGPFDQTSHLCIEDLVVLPDCVLLKLKRSKTDPFRAGVTIKLFKTDNSICPYDSCCRYMRIRRQHNPALGDPLFVTNNGNALSRSVFISMFKHVLVCLGINAELYNGHSFRIGAATTAAAAHIEDHMIKMLGRWSSDAYCRYIRTPQSLLRDAQKSLTSSLISS